MKKLLALLLAMTMVCSTAFAMAGCTETVEKVDEHKTQLYIGNYNGGVGEKWLDNAKARFEAAYANTSFEEGKTGVQIMIDHNKSYDGLSLPTSIATDQTRDMYFCGGGSYFDFVGLNTLYDLTNVITKKKIPGEDQTIADKMDPEVLANMTVNGKVYAAPHYQLYPGPSYDANLFEMEALYFVEAMDTDGMRKFKASQTDPAKKSCGPDGIMDTYDDGLPSTIQEFYKLIDRMVQKGIKPFIWTGDSPHYTNQVLRNLFANVGGIELLNANFDFDSKGETIEYVDGFDVNNRPIIKEAAITEENGYLVRQSAALYYILEFAQKVRSSDRNYEADGLALDHIGTQEAFVNSGKTFNGEDSVAMIIDGSWWWNEANDDGIFARFEETYPDNYAQKEFKVMPMPVKYEGTVKVGEGKAPVVYTGMDSLLLVNKNIDPEHVKVMEEFVTFIYSQTELLEFTKDTNGVLKGVNYNYSTIRGSLNSFAQSSLEILEAAKEAGSYKICFSANPIYMANKATFDIANNDWLSSGGVRFPISGFDTNTTLAKVREMFNSYKISSSTWNSQFNVHN